jgi:EAL domain-containing protein (putative c-di-GMP-specific phosphodiesterase class I)
MIDEHVLETALRRCAGWPSRPALCMSVNAGVDHLSDARLPERVARLLAELQLSPQQLVVEIPETSPLGETVVANLGRLRELGIRLALDDFGTGYSALARLQEIPPDIIKIDRAFIAPLADPGADVALLAGMVDLAHRVGAFVVAEGVEQPAQLDRLSAVGCDGAQGFLLGRPQAETDGVPAMWQMPVSPRFG